jgi:Lipopolysaccharide-assembly
MRPAFLSLLAFSFAGCLGYTLGPVKPNVMKDVHTIAVHAVHTDILQPRLESLIANVIIRHLQRDGTYQVADEKHADAILDCKLEALVRRPNRGVTGNQLLTAEYELTMRISYRLTNRVSGELIDTRTASGSAFFFSTGSSTIASDVNQDESQAIPVAADDMAKELVSELAEGW